MVLNTSLKQFVEKQTLNDLNRYLLYFPEENPKQLDQDEIIEIVDQAKAPEWHETMFNANIEILKCLMRNQFLISSAYRTWRRSGTPTVPILPHYQWIIRDLLPVV
jgi:hypothetical protein